MAGVLERFARSLYAVACISGYGLQKYGSLDGWERVPNARQRYGEAFGRHTLAACIETYDPESRYLHKAHRLWNALAELELMLRDGVELRAPIQEPTDAEKRAAYSAARQERREMLDEGAGDE